ncbi:hypothetical protein GQ473_05455 [archaeon]|nr:hypothetical protein [archaeon]
MTIASTGELENVVKYLVDLRMRKNYNILDLTTEFEEIVKNWDRIASFIKTEHSKKEIEKEIIKHLEMKEEIFFVFAYGRAVQSTTEVIANLNNQKIFSGKYFLNGIWNKNKSNIDYYSCFFEKSTF